MSGLLLLTAGISRETRPYSRVLYVAAGILGRQWAGRDLIASHGLKNVPAGDAEQPRSQTLADLGAAQQIQDKEFADFVGDALWRTEQRHDVPGQLEGDRCRHVRRLSGGGLVENLVHAPESSKPREACRAPQNTYRRGLASDPSASHHCR